ncbi:hypothetical protein HBF26_09050 [Luteibacter jiangsuensis]|uniref:Uncharacterized protein n=1 Tax=Luteibacter jiangsuensis TaxID=637577 RepID=A0ABX0Q5F2_9GAMM|nr:hypothetical protein [Luteibacter jiangsuensis]NID05031.1 hypothetical protein [Luteibacter jiangsuensis]
MSFFVRFHAHSVTPAIPLSMLCFWHFHWIAAYLSGIVSTGSKPSPLIPICAIGAFFRCADKETLSKLDAYCEKERNNYPEQMKEWDEYERLSQEERK